MANQIWIGNEATTESDFWALHSYPQLGIHWLALASTFCSHHEPLLVSDWLSLSAWLIKRPVRSQGALPFILYIDSLNQQPRQGVKEADRLTGIRHQTKEPLTSSPSVGWCWCKRATRASIRRMKIFERFPWGEGKSCFPILLVIPIFYWSTYNAMEGWCWWWFRWNRHRARDGVLGSRWWCEI